MKTEVKLDDGQIVCQFEITSGYVTVIKMKPNEARNFKAKMEAALKTLAQGDGK